MRMMKTMEKVSGKIAAGEFEHRTLNTEHSTSNRKQLPQEAALDLIAEYNLLMDEVAKILEIKLIAIYLVKEQPNRKPPGKADLRAILELAIDLLKPKKNRTIQEEALLAYAEKRLEELME